MYIREAAFIHVATVALIYGEKIQGRKPNKYEQILKESETRTWRNDCIWKQQMKDRNKMDKVDRQTDKGRRKDTTIQWKDMGGS